MKALIVCAGENKNDEALKEYAQKAEYVICADGGYDMCISADIIPDLVIGDFDSCTSVSNNTKKIVLPCEKDETDTLYAVR